MIQTPIGDIRILVNGQEKKYEFCELETKTENFSVDNRFQITFGEIEIGMIVSCVLESPFQNIESTPDSGERLEMISFYKDDLKLSIGVEGEIEGINYVLLKNGIEIRNEKSIYKPNLIINVAWLKMKNSEEEDIYCWLAADPKL